MAMTAISIYTPTHTTAFLPQAWESLRNQQGDIDYEWILVPNGDCSSLPAELLADRHVRVFPALGLTGRVGALKQFAVQHASGELLVELDHDDLLAPTTLATLQAQADVSKAQFLYSDFASFEGEFKPFQYPAEYGWEQYPVSLAGRQLQASRAFEPCPVSLGWLPFAPNHVRAWTRKAYDRAGGYSEQYDIVDDYDLMLRTYLSGAEFIHIPECLYFYREHRGGASKQRNAQVQELQQKLSDQNIDAVLEEWRDRQKLPAYELSISAGTESQFPVLTPLAKATRMEPLQGEAGKQNKTFHFDGLSDLADSSVGRLDINHLLPYLPPSLIVPLFEECYRVLAPRGWLRCRAPSTDGRAAFTNPLYRSFWNETTFWTFTKRKFAAMAGNQMARFYAARSWTAYPTWEHIAEQYAVACVDMVALKGQKQPGWIDI